jgi:hypothetical protein
MNAVRMEKMTETMIKLGHEVKKDGTSEKMARSKSEF